MLVETKSRVKEKKKNIQQIEEKQKQEKNDISNV